MIRTLVSQQLKAQRVYVAWTTALLAAAAALATYAWSAAATDGALTSAANYGPGIDRQFTVYSELVSEADSATIPGSPGVAVTANELVSVVDQANSEGAHAMAQAHGEATWMPVSEAEVDVTDRITNGQFQLVYALVGEDAWTTTVAHGSPPATGEIVIPAHAAQAHSLAVGDTVNVGVATSGGGTTTSDFDPDAPLLAVVETRTISGLSYDQTNWAGVEQFPEPFYLNIADPLITDSSRGGPVWMSIRWDHATPTTGASPVFAGAESFSTSSGPLQVLPVWLCIIMVGGVLVTATATGRAQAQQRAKWTATARALGATRGTVAVATIIEGALMGIVAAALGIAGGIAVAQLHLNNVYASLAAPPPVGIDVSAIQIGTITLVSMLLGLFITGLPALLATRVPPAAALQDTKAVDEVEFSRRVTIWPVVAGWLVAGGVVVWILADYSPGSLTPFWIAASIFAILTFTLMVEGSRRLAVWLGGWLLRRRSPAAIRAGLDMHGHPRQAAALMVVQMVTTTGIAGVGAASTVTAAYWYGATPAYLTLAKATESFAFLWRGGEVIVTVLIIASALCAAVFAGTQRMSNADSTTASALGLSPRDTRAATVLRLALPQGIGTLVGAGCGFACGSAVFLVADSWLSIWTQPSQIGVFLLIGGVIVAAMAVANLTLIALTSVPWLLRKRSATRRHDHEDVTASPLESSTR
ncbi:ABC transporter permease [Demequina sp. B12]|uniref:FtsX-like permease family protein n=1 Tax=Demequina sp. B12 TaxID=2992757 RepID=UPI00237B3A8A|nr:ABC transporter permease [Demequina sp. B12]MDE0571951.1 ABC transporter permease [Demequina sp. B12]